MHSYDNDNFEFQINGKLFFNVWLHFCDLFSLLVYIITITTRLKTDIFTTWNPRLLYQLDRVCLTTPVFYLLLGPAALQNPIHPQLISKVNEKRFGSPEIWTADLLVTCLPLDHSNPQFCPVLYKKMLQTKIGLVGIIHLVSLRPSVKFFKDFFKF